VGYFHVVFTLPAEVADVAFHNKALVYDLLFAPRRRKWALYQQDVLPRVPARVFNGVRKQMEDVAVG